MDMNEAIKSVIKQLIEKRKSSQKDFLEVEYAMVKNDLEENGEEGDLDEYDIDMYSATEWSAEFETWCGARSETHAFSVCLDALIDLLSEEDKREMGKLADEAGREARQKALKEVEDGNSLWLE